VRSHRVRGYVDILAALDARPSTHEEMHAGLMKTRTRDLVTLGGHFSRDEQ
jgi:hypothetical protein